jgi:Flp pilus assembly protein TadD
MCKSLAKVGEIQKAIEHLRFAIEIEPNDPLLRTALSLLLTQSAQPMDAELELRTALLLDPLSHDCYYKLGCVLDKKGALDEAEFALKRANELCPGKPMYERALCLHYAKSGNITEAITSAKRLSQLLPQNPHSHAYLGHLLANSGDLHGAESALRVALSLDASVVPFRELLTQVLRRQGRTDDATAEVEIGHALTLTNNEAADQVAAGHAGAR